MANRTPNARAVGGKLESIAIAAHNEDGAAALFFFCGSCGEKIICLEAPRFHILKAACRPDAIFGKDNPR